MQTLEITFQKNYHTSLEDRFLMETLIIKVQADTAGEDAQILWDKARQESELNHRRNNPNLFPPDIPIIPKKEWVQPINMYSNKPISDETLIFEIGTCNSVKTLESYKFIVKGKPDLETIYQNKLKELQ